VRSFLSFVIFRDLLLPKKEKKKKERTFEKEKSCYFGSLVPKRQVF